MIADKLEAMSRPVAAFISFETQEGFERACNLKRPKYAKRNYQAKHEFLGSPFHM
jgi:hypothetical protein